MFYSSCFDIEGKEDVVVLCECELEVEFEHYVIKKLSFSDGERIYERGHADRYDVQLHVEETQRDIVWDGYIGALSANSLPEPKGYDEEGTGPQDEPFFSQIVCILTDKNVSRLVMVKRVGMITRRLAELEVQLSNDAELDLFHLAKRMYQNLCDSNVSNRDLETASKRLRADADGLRDDMETMKYVTIERDRKTNSVMIGLLNEKKKKIRHLRLMIQAAGLDVPDEDLSDSEFINKYVTDEVKELNSPGKRRVAAWKETRPIKKLKPVKRKLDVKQEDHSISKNSDDFDDFNFLGISKSPEKKKSTEQRESDTDTGSSVDDKEGHGDSESSVDIKKESDVEIKMEPTDLNVVVTNSSSEDTATDINDIPEDNSIEVSGQEPSSDEDTDTEA